MSDSSKAPNQPTPPNPSLSMDAEPPQTPTPCQPGDSEGHPFVLNLSSDPTAPPKAPSRHRILERQGAEFFIGSPFDFSTQDPLQRSALTIPATPTISGPSTSKRGRDLGDSTHEKSVERSSRNPMTKSKVRVVEHGDVDGLKQELSDMRVELDFLRRGLSTISGEKEELQRDYLAVSEQLEQVMHTQKSSEASAAHALEHQDHQHRQREEELLRNIAELRQEKDALGGGYEEEKSLWMEMHTRTYNDVKKEWEEAIQCANQLRDEAMEQEEVTKRTLEERMVMLENRFKEEKEQLIAAQADVRQQAVQQREEAVRLVQDEHKRALEEQALEFKGKLEAQAQEHQASLSNIQETTFENVIEDRRELHRMRTRIEEGENFERQRAQRFEQDIDALRLARDNALQRAQVAEALQVTLDEAREHFIELNNRVGEIEDTARISTARIGREKEELLQRLNESERLVEVERQKGQHLEQEMMSLRSQVRNDQPEETSMNLDLPQSEHSHGKLPEDPIPRRNAQLRVANITSGAQEPIQETIRPPLTNQRAYGADTPLSERLRLPQPTTRDRTPLSTIPEQRPANSRASTPSHLHPPPRITRINTPAPYRPVECPRFLSPHPASNRSPSPHGPTTPSGPSSTSNPGPSDPPSGSDTFTRSETAFISTMKDMVDAVHALNTGMNARFEEMLSSPKKKARSYEHGEFTGRNASRPRSVARNRLSTAVRREMNEMLRIEHDEQIVDVASDAIVSPTEVAAFLASNDNPPTLDPLRPFWDKINSPWNDHLARSFAEYMRMKWPDLLAGPTEFKDCFMQRLTVLRKILSRNVPQYDGEPIEDTIRRVADGKKRELHEKRIRGRKTELFNSRLKISDAGSQGGVNEAWSLLYSMVDTLGINGNSSDETDTENHTTHLVRAKDWRSVEVRKLLEFIDENRKTTNAYGNALPGTRPRLRLRSRYPPTSRHAAVYELPRNFYSDIWFDSLTEVEQTHLDAKDPIPLPEISQNRLTTTL